MPRLTKVERKGKKLYRVILDSEKASTNYIEVTKGTVWNETKNEHYCLKCYDKPVKWDTWTTTSTAKNTCKCGMKATLSIISLDDGKAKLIRW